MVELLKKLGVFGLFLAGILEATILPLPMETISLPIYLVSKDKIPYLFIMLLLSSITGSIIGYLFWKRVGRVFKKKYINNDVFKKIKELYEKNAFLTLLTSAFTPLPFEGYVLTAGILEIDFKTFLLGVTLSRVLRHLPQAILLYIFGNKIIENLKIYSMIGIFIIFSLFLIKKILKRN
ncbi:YqaA family protein [Cetobacterium sp.]|uniref:YqaA family protein n=1 Tax=Cetobacterium sp. TaxID=2071632 RepID=UPI003F2CDB42